MEIYTVFKKTGKILLVSTGILLTFLFLCLFVLTPILVKNQRIIDFLERKVQKSTQVEIDIENIHWQPFSKIVFKNIKLSHKDLGLESEVDFVQLQYGNPWNLVHLNFESLAIKIKSFKMDLTNKQEEKQSTQKLNVPLKLIPCIKKINIEAEAFSFKNDQGNVRGMLSLASALSKNQTHLHLKLDHTQSQITFESSDGKIFIDKFKLEPQGDITFDFKKAPTLQAQLDLGLGGGEIVYHSFYANLKSTFFLAKIKTQLSYENEILKIAFPNIELIFEEESLLKVQGDIIPHNKFVDLHLSSQLKNLNGFTKIAKATLSETYALLKDLEAQGDMNLNIHINGLMSALSFTGEVGVNQLSLNIPSKKVSLKNTEILLPFSFSQTASRELASIQKTGKISFGSIVKNNLALNKISFHLNNTNNALSIKTPVTINILGGSINLKKTTMQVFPKENRHLEMSFAAKKLSFIKICDFLGLPKTRGTLHSKIDLLKLDANNLEMKGSTRLDAWEGSIVVKNINIAEPFGLVPTVGISSININQVRLLPISEDLGFGVIDGTIDGYIKNLTLIEHKPTSFDMEIKSVSGKNSSQVISVQAIKNITQLSGGDSGGFTDSFVFNIINTFKYSHLGFKAVLNGDLLQLEPNYSSGTTAYLIKGSFFPPSVDVLYKNEIHKKIPLPEMIDRLQNIDWQKTYVK